jgi:hypothetical protein
MTTVICLDDYHCLDRFGRKEKGVTALDPKAQDFDLMYQQVKDIRENKPISKPIYNHVTGLLDPEETIKPPKVSQQPQFPFLPRNGHLLRNSLKVQLQYTGCLLASSVHHGTYITLVILEVCASFWPEALK